MSLSLRARALINQAQFDEALFLLLTLNHQDWASPLRYVNSHADITSGGILYKSKVFTVPLPPESKDELPDISLTIDNVDREIGLKLREITHRKPGSATLSVIFSGDPDTVEIPAISLVWKTPTPTAKAVIFQLGPDVSLTETYPYHKYRPATHPGLFGNVV